MITTKRPIGMPPNDPEAELAILASLMINPANYDLVYDLRPEDFYQQQHRTIYEAFVRLVERREQPDPISVQAEIEMMGRIDDLEDPYYVLNLAAKSPSASGRGIETPARRVKDMATCKRIGDSLQGIAEDAYHGRAKAAQEQLEALVHGLHTNTGERDLVHASEMAGSFLQRLDLLTQHRGMVTGVPTGFIDLDRLTGGLQRSDLIILAARPAVGKTAWALNVGENAAQAGHGVAVFSQEMSKEQLWQRLVSMETGIDQQRFRTGHIYDEDWEAIIAAMERLTALPLYIDDTPRVTCNDIRSKVRRCKAPIDLIIVDYIQLMGTPGTKRQENRVQEVSEISRDLKQLAMELNVPILALAQLSRAVESRQSKIPQLSDLRESGSLEQDADIVLFIYRDEIYNPDTERKGMADIHLAKHRNGPVGEITLHFKASQTKFHNLEVSPPTFVGEEHTEDEEDQSWEN